MRSKSHACAFALVILSSCASTERWPRWADDVASHLRCGMTLNEIQAATDKGIVSLAGPHPWLGMYRISAGSTELWFQLKNGGLESIVLCTPDSLKTVRMSPRRDLCTGRLEFLVAVELPEELRGARIHLDGAEITHTNDTQVDLTVTVGDHELRIEQEGYMPIVRQLHFTNDDRGDHRLRLTRSELQTSKS